MRAVARFGQMATEFVTSQYDEEPRTVAFTAPLRLSMNELVAALWWSTETGTVTPEEMGNPETVRFLVADTIVNGGLQNLEEAAGQIAGLVPGSRDHAWLLEVRETVHRVFADVAPAAVSGHTLVGVSA